MYMHRYALLALVLTAFTIGATAPPAVAQGPTAIQAPLTIIRAGSRNLPSLVPPAPQSRPGVSPAGATINVTYNGFMPESRAAFQYAVDIWASQITSPVPIEVIATWRPLDPGVLGAARPTEFWQSFDPNVRQNVYYPVGLANKLAGRDINPDDGDIEAFFSSSFGNWYFGTDGATPSGMYDFVSVVLHELGHGLGYSGSMRVSGGQGSWGRGTGLPFIYDTFAQNGAGNSLLNTSLYPNPSVALGQQLTSSNIFWDGPNARAAAGGAPPKIYAPLPWESGSSYSHLDELTYEAGDPNSLMTPQIGQAEAIHDPGPIARGMFMDMGWTVQAPSDPALDGQLELDGGAAFTRDAEVSARITNRSTTTATGYALRDGSEPSASTGTFTEPTTTVPFILDTGDNACRSHTVYGKLYDSRGPSATFTDAIIYDPGVEASFEAKGIDTPTVPDSIYTRSSTYEIAYEAMPNECSGLQNVTVTYQSTPAGETPNPLGLDLDRPNGTVSVPFPTSAEGVYQFQLEARDNADNAHRYPANGSYQFVVDRTAPDGRLGLENTAPTQETVDGVAILNLDNLVVEDNLYPTVGGAGREYWGYRVVVKQSIDGAPSDAEWQQRGATGRGQITRLKWNLASGMVGRFVPGRDYIVYVQFLDGAGNASDPIRSMPITVQELQGPRVFLPMLRR